MLEGNFAKKDYYCWKCGVVVDEDLLKKKNEGIGTYQSTVVSCPFCGRYMVEYNTSIQQTIKKSVSIAKKEEDTSWNNESLKEINCCALLPEIYASMNADTFIKMHSLMNKMGSKEWLAYLIGERKEKTEENELEIYIKDLYLPKQYATSSSVDVLDSKRPEGYVGVIHSHHSMSKFFSGTDNEYINSNHDLSIVVAKDGMKGQYRFFPPCSKNGHYFTLDIEIYIDYPDVDTSNIQESRVVFGANPSLFNNDYEW